MMFSFFNKNKTAKNVRRATTVRRPVVKLGRAAFDAAQINNLFSEWETISKPINAQLESDLRTMRARSRNLAKNNPYMKRFFKLCRSNIVGAQGFILNSEVTLTNGKPARIEREAIQKAWKAFCKKGVPCAKGKMTMKDIQGMIVNQLFGDGEIIIRVLQGRDVGPHGIAFQFIDPELLDVNHKDNYRGNRVRMGIETDLGGRVVAYHFHSTDSTHEDYYTVGGRGYIRVDKANIIHEFFYEYVDQLRGFPEMVAAMSRLRQLDGYEEAEVVAARIGSSAMGFIERGENGGGFEENMTSEDDELDIEIESEEADDPEIETNPGDWHYIDHGAKIHSWSPSHPNTAYKDFVKTILRGIASGLGVDYNTLANDLEGVNFSSLRGGVLESREMWKLAQEWVVEHVIEEMFERWLFAALSTKNIVMPRGDHLSVLDIDRYKAHSFQARRWAWVDPVKDLQAAKMAIDERLASRSEIIRERGRDPDQVWDEIQKESEDLKKRGIEIKSVPTQSVVTNQSEETETNEDPENVEETENE